MRFEGRERRLWEEYKGKMSFVFFEIRNFFFISFFKSNGTKEEKQKKKKEIQNNQRKKRIYNKNKNKR